MEASADVIVPRQAWADIQACLEGNDVSDEGMARLRRLGFFEEGASADASDRPSSTAAEAAYESLSGVARDLLAPYWDSLGYVDLLVNDGGVLRHAAGWFGVGRASCVALDIDDSVALSL